jgi:hypothetical protein
VKALLSKGETNVHGRDAEGCTALHLAAKKGHTGIVRLLVAAGGLDLLQAMASNGRTPQDYAAAYRKKEAEHLLWELRDAITRELLQQEQCERECWAKAEQEAAEYKARYNEGSKDSVLTVSEYKEFVGNVRLGLLAKSKQEMCNRVVVEPMDLVCGEFEHAAKGFYKLLNVGRNIVNRGLELGVQAIEEEVMALGDEDVIEQLHYILKQRAREKMCHNGLRDKGRAGMRLRDFMKHKSAVTAELLEEEVVALRLYTTSAFKQINSPLRDQMRISRGDAHPLPVTVMLIIEGIKKLRRISTENEEATQEIVLWRGMKNMRPKDSFVDKGGTEV